MLKKKYLKTKDICEVTFELDANGASSAAVVGEFNNWEPIAMKKAKKADSPFRVTVRMPKNSEFQYRYLVDGEVWVNDAAADAYRANEHGSDNSVVNTAE
ncbi:MAG: isoamylase early set domain-containing protein [Anaerolineales bacterium]|nr:isoamylase early set domain-containing protein [Anaerolineales bacterium]